MPIAASFCTRLDWFRLSHRLLFLLLLPILAVACNRATANIEQKSLTEFSSARIERPLEWRSARALPAGDYYLNLGDAPPQSVLRLGVLERGMPGAPVRIEVLLGDTTVTTLQTDGEAVWKDQRIDLSAAPAASRDCHLAIHSAQPVWLGPCEFLVPNTNRPNVLVFLIDTLRYDHLNCDGYARDTAPNIAALARDGIRFSQFISPASWTRPAVGSLLTGVYPAVHGAQNRTDILRQDAPSLPGALRQTGYETHGFMSNPACIATWGFANGFDRFVDVDSFTIKPDKDADVVDDAIATMKNAAGRPWFMYVHAIGPHSPYEPPTPFDQKFQPTESELGRPITEHDRTIAAYDGEIGFTDAQFGRLVSELKKLGLYDTTLIVVLSDHGEEFWDHGGEGHGATLYDEVIHVPCIVKLPHAERAGQVYENIAQSVDIAPTILDALKLTPVKEFQGQSLLPALGAAEPPNRLAYSSLSLEKYNMYASRGGELKYIDDVAGGKKLWFDVAADAKELHPLETVPEQGAALAQFASQMNMRGAPGLHVVVTGSLASGQTITGRIAADGLGACQLYYPARNGSVEKKDRTVDFHITLAPGPTAPGMLLDWYDGQVEQNNAHIHINTGQLATAQVSLSIDGAPVPQDAIHIGRNIQAAKLDDFKVTSQELEANPDSFSPLVLPKKLGVYLWYVSDVDKIPDSKLDPGMANALHALGYLQ